MRLLFYVFAFIIISDSWQVISKNAYTTIGGRGGYLFCWGVWLGYYALFFLLFGDIKNWQHWIGFIIYLIVAICYWTVFKKGKTDQNASSGSDRPVRK